MQEKLIKNKINMKTINFILVTIALIFIITSCKAEKKYQLQIKKYEVFLDRLKRLIYHIIIKKMQNLIFYDKRRSYVFSTNERRRIIFN
jgi:hypothetical protein